MDHTIFLQFCCQQKKTCMENPRFVALKKITRNKSTANWKWSLCVVHAWKYLHFTSQFFYPSLEKNIRIKNYRINLWWYISAVVLFHLTYTSNHLQFIALLQHINFKGPRFVFSEALILGQFEINFQPVLIFLSTKGQFLYAFRYIFEFLE